MRRPSFPAPLDAQVQAAWQTQMKAAREIPGLLPTLAQHRQDLLPRFAGYYQHLNALPRRVRRALQRQWRHSLAGVAFMLALGIAGPAQAATILVDGVTCTLVDAITAANTDTITGGCAAGSGADTIVLPPGSTQMLTAVDNVVYGPNGLPVVKTAITIEGNGSTITRESGAPGFRLFFVEPPGNLTLQRTTVSGGRAVPAPNEPFFWGAGGGIFNYTATVTLIDSTISGNVANDKAGGVYNYLGGMLTVARSTISGNTAGGSGGGVFNYGMVAVTKSTISGNTAGFHGGGVNNDYAGIATLTNSTISGNTALHGGGVNNEGSLTLINSTLSGNIADADGGGVNNTRFAFHSKLTLVRTLVSGNSANNGPEIRSYSTNIVVDNFNLFGHDGASGVEGFSPGATDLVPTVPIGGILDPILADNGGPTLTHALVAGSPAVDAVTHGGCPAKDQRLFVRPVDGDRRVGARCDIGSVEFRPLRGPHGRAHQGGAGASPGPAGHGR